MMAAKSGIKSLAGTLLFALAGAAAADTIELHSGEILEGKILRETQLSVVVEVPFSETIMDERTIPKREIKSITRLPKDKAAYKEIESMELPASPKGPQDYDAYIAKHEAFLKDFAYSSMVEETRRRLAAAKAEREAIAAGGIKRDGVLTAADEISRDPREAAARRDLQAIRDAAAANDFRRALNLFSAFEKNHKGTEAFPDAVEDARESLRKLISRLGFDIRNHPVLEKKWKDSFALANPNDQKRMAAAREKQEADLKVAAEESKAAGELHPPFAAFSLPKMQEALKVAEKEKERLEAIDLAAINQSIAAAADAARRFAAKNWDAAEDAAKKALDLWPDNLRAKEIAEGAAKEKEAEAAKKAADAAAQGPPAGQPSN